MERHGRCLCGAVTFKVEGKPIVVAHCHCVDCQKLRSAGHTTGAMFPSDKIQALGNVSEFKLPSENASIVTRTFCPKCGSPLFGRNTKIPGFTTVEYIA